MVIRFAFLLAALVLAAPLAAAQGTPLTLASTTSTENSGLLGEILPRFTKDTGIAVRVVAVGTGAALNLGRSGDADILLVHAREDEDAFVAAGYGAFRRDVMFNDFVIVGATTGPCRDRCPKGRGQRVRHNRDARRPVRLTRGQQRHPQG